MLIFLKDCSCWHASQNLNKNQPKTLISAIVSLLFLYNGMYHAYDMLLASDVGST